MGRWARPLAALVCCAAALPALADDGRFLAISDVHLTPFLGTAADETILTASPSEWTALYDKADTAVVSYGADANPPLYRSALDAAARAIPAPDFVIYPGDFLAHHLAQRVDAVKADAGEAVLQDVAVNTTLYLGDSLKEAFGGVPVFPALGNTDSACGDYEIEPGGGYLTRTWPLVERLVGADLLAADAKATWLEGGFYRATHPTAPQTDIVVLNNIFWSPKYQNRCGSPGTDPGADMLAWLTRTLEETAERRVWLVYHVPSGINAYGTAHAAPASCSALTVLLWQPRFATAFAALMERFGDRVSAAFSGHVHRDTFRLMAGGKAIDSVVPSISPIFGNNPAFQVFSYQRTTGSLTDLTTYAATNLGAAAKGAETLAWQLEYTFTAAYGVPAYGGKALAALATSLSTPEPSARRTLYGRYYGAGHGDDPSGNWPVYGCTPGNTSMSAFNACRCGG